jgi:hypothetical protein
MDRQGSFEFTIKYILKVYDYYKDTCLKNQTDDERLPKSKEAEIIKIFNHDYNIENEKEMIESKSNPQDIDETKEGTDYNMNPSLHRDSHKSDDDAIINHDIHNLDDSKIHPSNLYLGNHPHSTSDGMPYVIKVLFKHMTPGVYKEKSNDPSWFYRSINL